MRNLVRHFFGQYALIVSALFIGSSAWAQKTRLTGHIDNLKVTSLTCALISSSLSEQPTSLIIPVEQGKFSYELNLAETTYLSFGDGTNYFGGFIQPGDSLRIHYDAADLANSLTSRGSGQAAFSLSRRIDQLQSLARPEIEKAKAASFPIDYLFRNMDSLEAPIAQQLASTKGTMDADCARQLEGYLKAALLRIKYNGIVGVFGDSFDHILVHQQARLSTLSKQHMANLFSFDASLSHSPFYVKMVKNVLSLYVEENQPAHSADKPEEKYRYLASKLPPALQAPVLFLLISQEITTYKEASMDSVIARWFSSPKDSTYKKLATQKLSEARMLKVGMPAPDFSLESITGRLVNLSSFRGKVIYLDFWFAGCGPCHQLFTAIKPVKKYFQADTNVVFLVVSIDSREVWKKAVDKFQIAGYHVFTENKIRKHPVLRAYQVWGYPTTYIIDPNGKFYSVAPANDADGLIHQLREALTVSAHSK